MIPRQEYECLAQQALNYLNKACIVLNNDEQKRIEVSDFGLNDINNIGLVAIVYINTARVCAKELILLPNQTCPEHKHPSEKGLPGKEETFRCRYGKVYLYIEGERTVSPHCKPPSGSEQYYTAVKEIILNPGEQYTLYPDTLHWFQAGNTGAVISEFSTRSTDETDIFTDPKIKRVSEITP